MQGSGHDRLLASDLREFLELGFDSSVAQLLAAGARG